MRTFITQTGIGYIREVATGRIVSRADLPIGEHRINDGFEFVQVNSRAELAAVTIEPEPVSETDEIEALIQTELRELAIERLVAKEKVRVDDGVTIHKN